MSQSSVVRRFENCIAPVAISSDVDSYYFSSYTSAYASTFYGEPTEYEMVVPSDPEVPRIRQCYIFPSVLLGPQVIPPMPIKTTTVGGKVRKFFGCPARRQPIRKEDIRLLTSKGF